MSTQIVKVMVPPVVAMPRGAVWASRLAAMLSGLGSKTWRALEVVGQSRARRELLRLARIHADRPEFARLLREASHRAVMSRD